MRMHAMLEVAVLTLLPAALAAQGPPRLGGEISFAQQEHAGVGLRLEQPLTPPGAADLRLLVNFDYFFPNSPFNYWELNTDLGWGFRIAGSDLAMYAGGGLNMARTSLSGVAGSGASEVGVNLVLGMRIPTSTRFRPYVELRPEIGGGNRLVLTTGILF
jgi:hypothetical protein